MGSRRSAFWEALTRFERHKISPAIASRNAIGLAVPLAVAAAMGHAGSGLVMATGALIVSFSDGSDPYLHRARRMLTASVSCALAVGIGGMLGQNHAVAALAAAAFAFAAGMMVAADTEAADIAAVTLVMFVIFSAQPMTPRRALVSALLALAGGLLQTLLSLSLWPVRRYAPERRALAALYAELGRAAELREPAAGAPPASAQASDAQSALDSLGGDHSVSAGRYLALMGQAERIRIGLLTLARLRTRMERADPSDPAISVLDRALSQAAAHLAAIASSLRDGTPSPAFPDLAPMAESLQSDARFQLVALAGQLRSASQLASDATPEGSARFEEREALRPWRLRFAGGLASLRANLHLRSAAFRHALRLAGCVAIGDYIGRHIDPQRGYWVSMTIVIILKPDFTSTFSRGLLRLGGTFAGLGLATLLFHLLQPRLVLEAILIVVLAFLLRSFGAAHYGIFVTALTALVVVMFAVIGIQPSQVMGARALNTVVGGVIALAAYSLWPTWERRQSNETLAAMLDGYVEYFHWVVEAHLKPDAGFRTELHRARRAGRLARSNAEASASRLRAEPGAAPPRLRSIDAILANSHRFIRAVMAIEAALANPGGAHPGQAFRHFAAQTEIMLRQLAAALRGTGEGGLPLPDLRRAQQAVAAEAGPGSLLEIETDRIANSLNTLSRDIAAASGQGTS